MVCLFVFYDGCLYCVVVEYWLKVCGVVIELVLLFGMFGVIFGCVVVGMGVVILLKWIMIEYVVCKELCMYVFDDFDSVMIYFVMFDEVFVLFEFDVLCVVFGW